MLQGPVLRPPTIISRIVSCHQRAVSTWPIYRLQPLSRAPLTVVRTVTHTPHKSSSGLSHPSKLAQPLLAPLYVALSEQLAGKITPAENNVVVLDPTVFNHPLRRDILHLCVVHHRDSLRQGSANTKTRGEVRGSGAKIRPQKGSGKARLGDGQSPMLVGGGVAFGPKPRDFSTKLPRKVIEMGMRVALSAKMQERKLGVVTQLSWPSGKTKHLAHKVDHLGMRKTLFVTGETKPPPMLARAIRNIQNVGLTTTAKLNVYELLKWHRLVLDIKAVEELERAYKKDAPIPTIAAHV